jgi:excisionase family DNA binding protein
MNRKKNGDDAQTMLRSFEQVMERLHCGRSKIYQLIKDKKLKRVKLGRIPLITERSIQELEAELLREGEIK